MNLITVRNLMLAIAGASCLALEPGQSAQAATLTFDEVPYQSVNGLSFNDVTLVQDKRL